MGTERRRSPRSRIDLDCAIGIHSDPGKVQNLSTEGLQVVLGSKLGIGRLIAVELQHPGGPALRRMVAVVEWCRLAHLEPERCVAGLRFVELSTSDQEGLHRLQALPNRPVHSAGR